jgi:hypothetical protein
MDEFRGFAPIEILEEWNTGLFNGQLAIIYNQ